METSGSAGATHPDLPGKNSLALVTGGAHRVGRIFCVELARLGFDIAIHFAHASDEAARTQDIIHAMGGQATLHQADLLSSRETQRLFTQICGLPHPLTVLVNNAAVMQKSDLLEITEAEWTEAMSLNVWSPLVASRLAAKCMGTNGWIINVSDYFASQTWVKRPLYGLTKSSLNHLTSLLAKRLYPDIRVNGLALAPVLPPEDFDPQEWQRVIEHSPGKKAVSSEQIGEAIRYLLTQPNQTGRTFPVTSLGMQTDFE